MSKRRINKQQSARIEKKQQSYRCDIDKNKNESIFDGLVLARLSRHAQVEDMNGNVVRCAIRPDVDSLVAGDRVVCLIEGDNYGVIVSRYPRKSILGRPDTQGNLRPIAANITQIMIVVAPIPEISWYLLDSYIVMSEHLKIQPFIILNKTDLPCDEIYHTLLKYYKPLGYPLLCTKNTNQSDKQLQESLNNQTSVFVGQSGVGKSSLIAKVLPHEAAKIQTASVSTISQLGCHTTSNSYLYHLPTGGALIDSPGIRELSLWSMSGPDIAKGYREFIPYTTHCKFRNCTHHKTPGCAIINAVKNKLIPLKRYENYVTIWSNNICNMDKKT